MHTCPHTHKRILLAVLIIAAAIMSNTITIPNTSATDITYPIPPNYTTFLDANLYDCVAKAYAEKGGTVPTDGLTDEQLATITYLYCNGNPDNNEKPDEEKIADTTGIEKMTSLTGLFLQYNLITTIDVSNNTALQRLSVGHNQLTNLDVSHNTALKELYVYHNQLTNLDVSHNTMLSYLSMHHNNLTTLDVSHNTALETLYAYDNQLTTMDVSDKSKLQLLSVFNNKLTTLDISHDTALKELYVYNNQLTTLNVSDNTSLEVLQTYTNQLSTLDISKNTALTNFKTDNIPIKANLVPTSLNPSSFDLSNLLWFDKENRTIADTEDYSFNSDNKLLTITNPTVSYVQITGNNNASHKLLIPDTHNQDEDSTDPKAPDTHNQDEDSTGPKAPDTGESTELINGATTSITVVLFVIGAIVLSYKLKPKTHKIGFYKY